ncbi:MAG: heparin lyase I family protein [Solirubrobacterales bacterium]
MLYLLTTARESDRLLFGVFVFALAMLMACVFALAAGVAGTQSQGGSLRTGGAVQRLHQVAPPKRTALTTRRDARRRAGVSRRIAAAGLVGPVPAGTSPAPPAAATPSPQLVAIEAPATTPASPPASSPDPPPAPEPPPPPPAPEPPPPPPPPAPEPPPPPPPPAPEPPPPPPPGPQPNGEVLFKATFDSGFGGWYVQSLKGRATTPTVDPFEGPRAARFEVRDGDVEPDTGSERSEVSGPTFKEGEDLYIRDAISIPAGSTFEGPWQIIQQLHEEDWSGSPGMAVFLDSRPGLKIGGGDGSPTFWTSSALDHDVWYDLIYRVNLSQDPSVGFVEVWLDGVQQTLANGQTRMYGLTIQAEETYIKAGIYRSKSSTGTSIVEHDSIIIGTSLDAVRAG